MINKLKVIDYKYINIIVILIIALFIMLQYPVIVKSFYSALISYQSVGTDISNYSVGTGISIILVGDGGVIPVSTPVSPLEAYTGSKPIVLIIPGLLLLSFVVWFFWQGSMSIRQGEVAQASLYYLVSFVLIGFVMLIAMPLIISGADSIIWFK